MKKIYPLLSLALGLLTACESYTDPTLSAPTVVTGAAENIYRMGATLSGSFTDASPQVPAKECGILLSEMQSMPEPKVLQCGTVASGVLFRIELRDLKPGKTYYYQSYAGSGESVVKGEVSSFTTTYSNPPVFEAPEVVKQTPTSCTIATTLIDDGDSEMLMTGYFWKEDDGSGEEPTFVDPSVNAVYTSGTYQASFKNLRPGRTYLIRPYGVNKEGVGLGKTLTVVMEQGGVPSLIQPEASATTRYSAQFTSRVYDTGTSAYKQVGFCWSTTKAYPTIEDKHQIIDLPAEEGGTFSFPFEASEQLTTYYICAFAENDEGIGYSEPFEFTTERFIELNSFSANGQSITVYGQVFRQSGHFQLAYAESESALDNPSDPEVLWSSMQPTMDADGKFTETRSDLKPSTTYYVRAMMGSDNPMYSNTLRIQTNAAGEEGGGEGGEEEEPTATLLPATQSEASQALESIQQLINQVCQAFVADANVQGVANTDGSVTYTLDVALQNMGDNQPLTIKAPKFVGFASTITPDYTSADSETNGQQWLATAETQLSMSYGMKNEGQDVTLEGKSGNRLTGYRITMEFTVKTMEYDNIKGQLVYSNFTKVENVTYEEVEPTPDPEPENPDNTGSDGSIDDAPVEDL